MTLFEQLFSWMIKPKVMLSYLLFVLLSYYFIDKNLAMMLFEHHINIQYSFLSGLTLFGESKFFLVGLISVALICRYIVRNPTYEARAWFLWLCVFIPNLICLILKIVIGRARPEMLFQDNLFGFYGFQHHSVYWSLPSGHTTTIISLACGLSILFPRHSWLYFVVAFAIAATRILLLQHYLSDVLTAAFLAVVEVGALWFVLCRKECLQRILPNTQMVDLK